MGPVRRYRSLPPTTRRLVFGEAVLVLMLVALLALVRNRGGAWEAVAVAAMGYMVGLVVHLGLVMSGWTARRGGRDR